MSCTLCAEGGIKNFKDFNESCFCSTKDQESPYGNFSSHSAVFLSHAIVENIHASITVLEKTIRSSYFADLVSAEGDPISSNTNGGLLMSYDFHLDEETPKLIEINTNAGGFFLSYELLKASKNCCTHAKAQDIETMEETIVAMFRNEFKKISDKPLGTVAIVDENPSGQFLYPEFQICKDILEKHGITTYILSPEEITVEHEMAYYEGKVIDLIYNRLTDFYFNEEKNAKFIPLLRNTKTLISPSLDDHKLFADKINFIHFQNPATYKDTLSLDEITTLTTSIPETKLVTLENKDTLWEGRKKYFFKPLNSYGSKGAYNGKGLTKKVWESIITQPYIAQEIVKPNTKIKEIDGAEEPFKFDIRAYTYNGKVLLLGARIYRGQTTNFRTVGGGFAPIFLTEN
ncbi:MAG: circularly permuted ATPgrasp domain protein [Candidatus Paceibacterota bacterium]